MEIEAKNCKFSSQRNRQASLSAVDQRYLKGGTADTSVRVGERRRSRTGLGEGNSME